MDKLVKINIHQLCHLGVGHSGVGHSGVGHLDG